MTKRHLGYLALAAWIATIFCANWALTVFGFVPVGFGLVAPAGVYFAGLAFSLRDAVREKLGLRWAFAAIGAGALLSALVSPQYALASGVAFGLSELADALVYEPLRRRSWAWAVGASNVAGFCADSALFLLLAFGSLDFLAGQLLGKAWMTALAVAVVWVWRETRERRAASCI